MSELTCKEMVELVTDYLEDRLPASERARFEEHLAVCGDCRTYVDQLSRTADALGRLREEDLSPAARDRLLEAFRDWRTGA